MLHLVGSSILLYLIDDARPNKNQVKYIHHYFFPKFLTKKSLCVLWAGKYGMTNVISSLLSHSYLFWFVLYKWMHFVLPSPCSLCNWYYGSRASALIIKNELNWIVVAVQTTNHSVPNLKYADVCFYDLHWNRNNPSYRDWFTGHILNV